MAARRSRTGRVSAGRSQWRHVPGKPVGMTRRPQSRFRTNPPAGPCEQYGPPSWQYAWLHWGNNICTIVCEIGFVTPNCYNLHNSIRSSVLSTYSQPTLVPVGRASWCSGLVRKGRESVCRLRAVGCSLALQSFLFRHQARGDDQALGTLSLSPIVHWATARHSPRKEDHATRTCP